MAKKGRIQFRVDGELEEWFRDFARGRGGQTRILEDHLLALRAKEREESVRRGQAG